MAPIFSGGRPVFLTASRLAIRAATSTGAFSGRIWSMRPGNRTRISLVTAGQAELMTGRGRRPVCISFRVAAETISRRLRHLKDVVKPEGQKGRQDDVDILEVIKLRHKRRRRQGNRIFVVL